MPERHDESDIGANVEQESLTISVPSAMIVFRRSGQVGTVGLRFGRLGVGPDVSIQPAAVTAVIDDRARSVGVDPNRWRLATLRALVGWAPNLDWCEHEPGRLTGAVGAFTHPLLVELYRQGRTPLTDIPRWASPMLRCTTAADATRLLSPGDTTRRLTRAVAGSLCGPDGTVALGPLAFGVAGAGLVSSDVLANVVEAASGSPVASPPIDVEQLRVIRNGLGHYPPARRAALLIDAARHQTPKRFAELVAHLCWIVDHAPRPLPQRVDELAELCTRLIPALAVASPPLAPAPGPDPTSACIDILETLGMLESPPTRTPGAAPVAPSQRSTPAARRHHRQPTAALPAPAAPAASPVRWPVPRALLAISDRRSNDLTFCVPTSAGELTRWSRQLDNCLDGFAAAAAHERSWLIGLRRDDHLIGCIEVCPRTRRIRQAKGPRNAALPGDVYDIAMAVLADAGIVHASTV